MSIWLAAAYAERWDGVSRSASSAGSASSFAMPAPNTEPAEPAEPADVLKGTDVVEYEERAAALGFDVGAVRSAVERSFPSPDAFHDPIITDWQARIEAITVDDYQTNFWAQAIADARQAFLQGWARQAAALGWSEIDLFEVHPTAPEHRVDCKGLIPSLGGRPIQAITRDEAVIDAGGGARSTFYRGSHNTYSEAKPMWEAADA